MYAHSDQPIGRRAAAMVALALILLLTFGPLAGAARGSGAAFPDPCSLPGVSFICDAVGGAAGDLVGSAAATIMRGATAWVTETAVWVTGQVGNLIALTTSPNVEAGWFQGQYASMLTVAGALAAPLLLLAIIQGVIRQDLWILVRSAFGYLPVAFILAAAATVATQLLLSITDDLSLLVADNVGGASSNLLQSVGNAYTTALNDTSTGAVPLFGIFLGSIILAVGAFVLWLEMIIRDAAIYIALFFLPLTFVAMIWPATGRWARRLVELLVAIILAKFVIVSILSLATAAITNTALDSGTSGEFEQMIAGSALLVLTAWSPFALLRLIPMMEVAAASVTGQRQAVAGAAASAGIPTPAATMRQAIDRQSRASTSPASSGTPRATPTGQATGSGATTTAAGATGGATATAAGSPAVAYAPSAASPAPTRPSGSGGSTVPAPPSAARPDRPRPDRRPEGGE
jgi:hypothetical protein